MAPSKQASAVTPGQAAHNAWCAEDDWAELDSDARALWETAALAGIAAYAATGRVDNAAD